MRRDSDTGWWRRFVVGAPYLWLMVFFLLPFLIVLKISLSQTVIAQPPYTPVLDASAGLAGLRDFVAGLSFENYRTLAGDWIYVASYLKSVQMALVATAILLAIGYPVAYGMARAPERWRPILLMLVILPFWTAFLIRVYAWITILQRDGLLNLTLTALGVIDDPVAWLASDTAVMIGLVYSYLPFMVLPLYAVLDKIDDTLLEAAADLGAPRWKAFWLVTVPLSLPGIGAGILLSFIPIMGEFVIPDLLGSSTDLMIGQTLWMEFFANRDWPIASAVAVVLLVLLLAPILLHQRVQSSEIERG